MKVKLFNLACAHSSLLREKKISRGNLLSVLLLKSEKDLCKYICTSNNDYS